MKSSRLLKTELDVLLYFRKTHLNPKPALIKDKHSFGQSWHFLTKTSIRYCILQHRLKIWSLKLWLIIIFWPVIIYRCKKSWQKLNGAFCVFWALGKADWSAFRVIVFFSSACNSTDCEDQTMHSRSLVHRYLIREKLVLWKFQITTHRVTFQGLYLNDGFKVLTEKFVPVNKMMTFRRVFPCIFFANSS